jgi:hypothetical protein
MFKVESATVTTTQRIQIRKLFQKVGISSKQGEELACVPHFLQQLMELASRAGGEAPKPAAPTPSNIDEIRLMAGNDQLLALYNLRDELGSSIDLWTQLGDRITKRWPNWLLLKRLTHHAAGLKDFDAIQMQVATIEQQRQLIEDPDQITPLINNLAQLLREELNSLKNQWDQRWKEGEQKLETDENWSQLEPEQRHELRSRQQLVGTTIPEVHLEDTASIISTLDACGLQAFQDRIAAMPARFDQVLLGAAKLMEPEIQDVTLPCRTMKTEEEIDQWLNDAEKILKEALKKGPVLV